MEVCVLTPADLDKFAHLFPADLPQRLPGDELLLGCAEADPPAAAGILMAHVEQGQVFIDWLYVDEPMRRRGGGRAMLRLLTETAEASGRCGSVSLLFSEDDEGVEQLLRACDFLVIVRGGDCGYVTELGRFPRLPAPGEKQGELVTLGEVPEAEKRRFAAVLDDSVIPDTALPYPFDETEYLPDSGVCLEDGHIRAAVLLQETDGALTIAWIYNACTAPGTFLDLLNATIARLKEKYPASTQLGFASVNPDVRDIIENYIPVKERVEVYLGTYVMDL